MLRVVLLFLMLGVVNIGFWYVTHPVWFKEQFGKQPPVSQATDPVVLDVFIYTLEEEVRKKEGVPQAGYIPEMFLNVFPGLAETDFEGVEASIGYYTIEQGRLVHMLDEGVLIHDTATAITRRGMETLLYNIANRTHIDLQTDGTITDIVGVLIRQ